MTVAMPAASTSAATQPVCLADLQARLGKKAQFEAAVKELEGACGAGGQVAAGDAMVLAARVHTLLRSRFTTPGFWKAGAALWRQLQQREGLDESDRAKLSCYLADARELLEAELEAPPPRQPTLGELLLGLPPPAQRQSHLSDAGLVLPDDRPLLPAARPAAAAAEAAAGAEGGGASLAGLLAPGAAAEDGSEGDEAAQQRAAAEQLAAALAGEGGEVHREEMEAMLAAMMDASPAQPPSRPPAAKRVVAALPRTTVGADTLPGLGGPGTSCPVCTEELAEGDEVQQLPCKHVFHPPCLAPWLAGNNSCPTCRLELETDDWQYEARKEREAEEAEAQRGAENAHSHNEFMYI